MKTPFARLWSVLRGDRYMRNAYAPATDATADAATATSHTPGASPPPER